MSNDPKSKKVPEPKLTFVQQVIKGDTYMVLADSAVQPEDDFTNLYWSASQPNNLAINPPYPPATLKHLVFHNNILNQCIHAMEVNIDGTGHEFVSVEEGKEADKEEVKRATSFFNEPYPNTSFVKQRRTARRELESVGYTFIEVLRNLSGDIVSVRNVETNNTRFVKLDDPVEVEKEIERDGGTVKIKLMDRERRFLQKIGTSYERYYREFGSTRQLHKKTGKWEGQDDQHQTIPPEDRATELLVMGVDPDIATPYFVPRWINQLPSVVGSRKAEEQNLEFFDAGGMPPAIIFIQGGMLAKDAADQLRNYLSGYNKNRSRAVVVEAQSSSGTLDAAGSVQVKVERFGAERANDAMYSQYDDKAEEHVRMGFRLPPLFLGKAADYNFATAVTSYMVAEAQVFQPEREEFDEMINKTLMKSLGFKKIRFKSKPITLKDIANQLKGLELAKDMVEGEEWVKEMNQLTGMSLQYKEPPEPPEPGMQPATLGPDGKPVPLVDNRTGGMVTPFETKPPAPQRPMKKSSGEMIALVDKYMALEALHPRLTPDDVPESERAVVLETVRKLEGDDLTDFREMLSRLLFGRAEPDLIHTH